MSKSAIQADLLDRAIRESYRDGKKYITDDAIAKSGDVWSDPERAEKVRTFALSLLKPKPFDDEFIANLHGLQSVVASKTYGYIELFLQAVGSEVLQKYEGLQIRQYSKPLAFFATQNCDLPGYFFAVEIETFREFILRQEFDIIRKLHNPASLTAFDKPFQRPEDHGAMKRFVIAGSLMFAFVMMTGFIVLRSI